MILRDRDQGPPRPTSRLSSQSLFGGHSLHAEKCRLEAKLTCTTVVRDYCNKTAVHGFRYFFEERSPLERAFWVCAVFLSFASCFFLISRVWLKWDSNPVIVTFSDSPTPIWQVPFPATTICPSTKSKQSLFNYTRTQHRVQDQVATETERWQYQALSLICTPDGGGDFRLNESAPDFISKVAPRLNEVLIECYWQSVRIDCSTYFRELLTEDGVCFAFNALGARELLAADTVQAQDEPVAFTSAGWTEDGGYDDHGRLVYQFFPLRQTFVGPYVGLRVILQSEDADMDYVCRGCEQGFRVYLHNPTQDPTMTQHYTALPLDASMYLLARPSLMTTTAGLAGYAPARRSCYFSGERPLRFYRLYSQENCIYECFVNMTIDKCGCIPVGMPRLRGLPICSFLSNCTLDTFQAIIRDAQKHIPFEGPYPKECRCLSSCTTLRYDADATAFHYPWQLEELARRNSSFAKGTSRSQLTVYFDAMQFVSSRRSELYGHIDFLANTGGLLGLFTGFSVISLIEIGYYASLRLWCDVKRRREERGRRAAGSTGLSGTG